MIRNIKAALFGVAIGDALGVPVEFKSRAEISLDPVTDMRGYGTYGLPAGTFSDDSSLTFCLAEALTKDFNLNTIAQNFVKWCYENYWTADDVVFDIGIATSEAINRIALGTDPVFAGSATTESNGNGSLMRILPLIFYTINKPISERFQITQQVSSLTHRHVRSVIACFYYLEFARQLISGTDKFVIYENLKTEIPNFLNSLAIHPAEIELFNRLLTENIFDLTADDISSSGYVLHSLEASIWCLLTTNTYQEATLKAVNLGRDTDTTGAITGGLAGLLYGFEGIPKSWIDGLARKEDIDDLAERLAAKIESSK